MKAMHLLFFVTGILTFLACSDDKSNDSLSDDSPYETKGKYACYIDASDLTISFTDEKYGPGHYYCYDYSEPSMQKLMLGCLMVTGGEALEECPQGYTKKCKNPVYNADNDYQFSGFTYEYMYGEKYSNYECGNEQKAYCINKQTGCYKNTEACEYSDITTDISCNTVKFCYREFFSKYSCYLIDGENKKNFYKSELDCLKDPENEVYTQEQCINAGSDFGFMHGS